MSNKRKVNVNNTVFCNNLVLNPKTTSIKWRPSSYKSGIRIIENGDTAKTTIKGNSNGVISTEGFVIGTDENIWYYCSLIDSVVYVGMAYEDQDLTTSDGVVARELIEVNDNDNIRFELNKNGTLLITHERSINSIPKAIKKYKHDLSALNGKKLFAWVSTTKTTNMSMKIMYYLPYELSLGPNGDVFINGKKSDTQNGTIVGENGSINLDGGVTYKCSDINSNVEEYSLKLSDYAVTISNPMIKRVVLPLASGAPCQFYSIMRNYPEQAGESWRDSVLKIYTSGADLIENDSNNCGIPASANVQIMSDGISNWRIV